MAEAGKDDEALLLDMKLAAQDAVGFLAGMDEAKFLASSLHQNAVIRCLEVVGEAASKVSTTLKAAHPEVTLARYHCDATQANSRLRRSSVGLCLGGSSAGSSATGDRAGAINTRAALR